MKNLIKLRGFLRPYWLYSILALMMLVAVVFMDLAIPRLVQRIIDQGINAQNFQVVVQTSLIMLGISVISAAFAIVNNYTSVVVGESVARDLRESMFLKIQSFSFGNLDDLKTGQLIVRLTSDVSVIQRVVMLSLRIGTRAPLLMAGSLILMFNTNARLAFSILPILLIVSILIGIFVLKIGPLFHTVQEKLDVLNTVLQENIAGVRVVKAFVRAGHEKERFERVNEDYTERSIRVMQIHAVMFPIMVSFINLGIVLVVWAGGLISIQGGMTVGEIVAFTNYLLTTMWPLMIMAMVSTALAQAFVSSGRVNEVLGTIAEVQDIPDAQPLPVNASGHILFKDVSFNYNGHCEESVLQDVNLEIKPGQTVAILGATGAGKSSLVNLIPRFYDANTGSIMIDGIDVRQCQQQSLFNVIGIVPQETILFAGSIRENIRYGYPAASEEEVIVAAKAAQAHDFILELPEGYDTHVEQRGVNLSGGQKQRIAIARAILTNPKILILDDSTSSVDVETETRIEKALDDILRGNTRVVIAQRISTVLNCDKIIVLDKGQVVAQGTHQELMRSSLIYQEIYRSQLGDGNGFELIEAVAGVIENVK
jgi:ATP-binding cassette, subfamily B, multidrug efflux pump